MKDENLLIKTLWNDTDRHTRYVISRYVCNSIFSSTPELSASRSSFRIQLAVFLIYHTINLFTSCFDSRCDLYFHEKRIYPIDKCSGYSRYKKRYISI